MVQISHAQLRLAVVMATSLAFTMSFAAGQTPVAQEKKGAVTATSSSDTEREITGDWQVSWLGRLGAEQCLLHLERAGDGGKLSGTFKNSHGLSSLSGNLVKGQLSFDVHFEGARPYTIRFKGSTHGDKIEGTSQAIGMGGAGAYLGHGGEVVQPEHPWTATRVAAASAQSADAEASHAAQGGN